MNFTSNEVEFLRDFGEIPKFAQSFPPFKCSIPVIPSKVPRSEQVSTLSFVKKLTTRKRKLEMFLYDNDVLGGDIVRVFVNGRSYGDITLTPKPGKRIEIDLGNEPGDKVIVFRFAKDGGVTAEDGTPLVTLAVRIEERDVVESDFDPKYIRLSMKFLEESIITVIYPRIRISISKYPQSACHIAEAWRVPPVPMERPIPGKPENPLRPSYPRVLTRANVAVKNVNRRNSTKNYQCLKSQNGKKEQRDEYPPAALVENAGSAHIKCIDADDNGKSGNDFGGQLDRYGSKKVKILPGDTVAMIKLYSGSIFADHNQFFLLDGNLDYREFLEHWSSDSSKLGYITINGGIAVITVGSYWVHWIEVYFSENSPVLQDCERAVVLNINILTEKFLITAPACCDEIFINIAPGYHTAYILCYNLGKESDEELSDEELEQRTDLERYKIVLVPGKTDKEGVIKGSKYLPDCIQEEEEIENV